MNIGWLQKLRANAAARVMVRGAVANKVSYGTHADADYKNLDALVYDAYKSLLDPWFAEDPLLVAIVGRDLMHDKLFPLVADNDAPTERLLLTSSSASAAWAGCRPWWRLTSRRARCW